MGMLWNFTKFSIASKEQGREKSVETIEKGILFNSFLMLSHESFSFPFLTAAGLLLSCLVKHNKSGCLHLSRAAARARRRNVKKERNFISYYGRNET
jgi:hypothetical protein